MWSESCLQCFDVIAELLHRGVLPRASMVATYTQCSTLLSQDLRYAAYFARVGRVEDALLALLGEELENCTLPQGDEEFQAAFGEHACI